jgi:hypothetical protein
MVSNREHPLYYLDAETLLVAIYVRVDDELKALQAQGFKLPPKQRHQKATLAELLTLAIFLLLQGQDLAKGYLAAKTTLKAYFPSLPHLSRFYRVLQKAQGLLAHLAIRLSGGQGLLQVVDLKPIPLAHGHRVHGLSLPAVHLGKGPQSSRRGRGAPGRVRRLRADAGDERAGPLFSLGPSPRKCPGDLGEGLGGGPPRGLGGPGIPLGPGGQDPTLSGQGRKVGGNRVEKVDGEGAQLDRNAVQRDGAVFGPSSDRGSVLLGPGSPGKPPSAGSQPHSEPGLAQDGRGGAMR